MLKNMPFEPEDLQPFATLVAKSKPEAKPEVETVQEIVQENKDYTLYGVLSFIGVAYIYLAPRSPLVPVLFVVGALKFVEWICKHGLIL
jgi:hypothetical protein